MIEQSVLRGHRRLGDRCRSTFYKWNTVHPLRWERKWRIQPMKIQTRRAPGPRPSLQERGCTANVPVPRKGQTFVFGRYWGVIQVGTKLKKKKRLRRHRDFERTIARAYCGVVGVIERTPNESRLCFSPPGDCFTPVQVKLGRKKKTLSLCYSFPPRVQILSTL